MALGVARYWGVFGALFRQACGSLRSYRSSGGVAARDWRKPMLAVVGVLLMEFGDFAMMRRMLHGIKDRAESLE